MVSNSNSNNDHHHLDMVERSLKYGIPECYHEYLYFKQEKDLLIMHITTNLHHRLIKQMFGNMFMSLAFDSSFQIASIEQDQGTHRENIWRIKIRNK